MPLTDVLIRAAKPSPSFQRLSDGNGLYLLVRPDGARWWRWDYRRPNRSRNTLSLGTYPAVSLKSAREKRDELRRLLAAGVDPGAQRRLSKAEEASAPKPEAFTFGQVTREWLKSRRWVQTYQIKVESWMEKDVLPWIGAVPVANVTAPQILACLRRVEERGAQESAHRILQNCSQILRYAIAAGYADKNPAENLRGALPPAAEVHRAAITEPRQLAGLLRAIDSYQGSLVTRCALQLAPLTFVRPGELRNAEWSEVDLEKAQWNIPASKMKMREPHLVPLSTQATQVLRELRPLTGGGRYVFPSPRTDSKPMSNNAVLAALRRMGFGKEEMSGHGFRATARTILDEVLNVRPDLIEHQLAHAVRDPNGRAYNRTAHLAERTKMMQVWADYLKALKSE